jgi:hypothetical protein
MKTKNEAAKEVSFVSVKNRRTGKSKIRAVPVPTASPSPKKRRLSKAAAAGASKKHLSSLGEDSSVPTPVSNQFSIEDFLMDYDGSDWLQSSSPPKAKLRKVCPLSTLYIIYFIFHFRIDQRQLQTIF